MRLASLYYFDEPRIARLDPDGSMYLIEGYSELGPDVEFGSLLRAAERADIRVSSETVTLRPATPRPRRVICLGLNYRSHIEETVRQPPMYPVLFTKWSTSLVAAAAKVHLPPESQQVDFEAELAIVIGRPGRRIPEHHAYDHIAGYTIANDITMRDFQYKSHQWLQGKAWDDSTPIGPVVVTPDEVGDPGELKIGLALNGRTMQASSTRHMIFKVPHILALVSTFTKLECGDLILTGTPGGVGYRRSPQVFLEPGDTVSVTIEKLGTLTNTIASAQEIDG